jgi:hypothetical protein
VLSSRGGLNYPVITITEGKGLVPVEATHLAITGNTNVAWSVELTSEVGIRYLESVAVSSYATKLKVEFPLADLRKLGATSIKLTFSQFNIVPVPYEVTLDFAEAVVSE